MPHSTRQAVIKWAASVLLTLAAGYVGAYLAGEAGFSSTFFSIAHEVGGTQEKFDDETICGCCLSQGITTNSDGLPKVRRLRRIWLRYPSVIWNSSIASRHEHRMTDRPPTVAYLIFDVEAVADGDLIRRVRYSDNDLTAAEAIARYRAELIEQKGNDVIPPTFMLPISVAIAKVTPDFRLDDLTVLDPPEYRPAEIARRFWQGWRHYGRPAFVTFNGRGYDLPVLELAAYRYGLALPEWFNVQARSFEQSRNRYNTNAHIDLMDLISNFSATRIVGGLNLLANMIGKPGKTGIDGSQIQDMYDAGEVEPINDYCRCDVLDTYFVFLRTRVMLGKLPLDEEQRIVDETKIWLEEQSSDSPAYTHYLEHWGDWQPPE